MELAIVNNTTEIAVRPVFDLEEFMHFSKETRLDGDALESLGVLWENWAQKLAALQIGGGAHPWLAVWLPASVEEAVDAAWSQSPSQGYLMNCLAQYMCMSAVQELLPQTAAGGCAPAPRPDAALRAPLEELALVGANGALVRRYAVITYYPFRGGCEICALNADCPKAQGAESFASILLPGYER